jgi:tRNA (cmo5U34)-methyltransferase
MFYEQVHNGLSGDGVFIVVEKVLGETPVSQALLVDTYHNFKRDKGYTDEQIEDKRKSLQGVLVPLRASENESMLKDAGFTDVQRFWQCLNFAGWVAFK